MGILRYNYRSEVLGMHTDITITYPSGQYTCYTPEKEGNSIFKRGNLRYKPDMKLPTVYILHGGGDDDSLLYRYTRLEYYAEQNQVMTVTAQAHDSFFIDTAYGIPYYTFFSEELPVVVQSLFASSTRREDNFLIGMAMGGNAALMMAMKRPDLFAACVDLSGGIGCSLDSKYFVESFDQIRMVPLVIRESWQIRSLILDIMPERIWKMGWSFRNCILQLEKMILSGMWCGRIGTN